MLPNSNHKIRQTQLDWLRNHPRLVFLELDEIADIATFIDSLLSVPYGRMDESPVDMAEYNDLKKALVAI